MHAYSMKIWQGILQLATNCKLFVNHSSTGIFQCSVLLIASPYHPPSCEKYLAYTE